MIDYEKLKQVHIWCDQLSEKIECSIYFQVQHRGKLISSISVWIDYREGEFELNFDSIDELIIKLKELTKPQPKYKVGDVVYLLGDDNNPVDSFKIDEIIHDEGSYWYLNYTSEGDYSDGGRDFDQYRGDCLYPSREALIEAQVDYWLGMLEMPEQIRYFAKQAKPIEDNESVTDCHRLECDHEWESELEPLPLASTNPRLHVTNNAIKCKKCGETATCSHDMSMKPTASCCSAHAGGYEECKPGECAHEYNPFIDIDNNLGVQCELCKHVKWECKHEPSMYGAKQLGSTPDTEHEKCKKCGEFYR